MKKLVMLLVLLVSVVLVIGSCSKATEPPRSPVVTQTPSSSQNSHARAETRDFAAKGRIPAHYQTAPDSTTLPKTLSPDLFTGNVRLAYQAAREIPETLAQLPCYCHCDKSHGHKSLHSCFASDHGESCGICIGEALMAYNLQKRGGLNAAQIRERIIAAYGEAPME